MGPLENFGRKAIDLHVMRPASRIAAKVGAEKDPVSKGSTLLAETLKEGALLPFQSVGAISSWAFGKMAKVLEGTVSLGMNAAMLIPLPLPGGTKSGTDVRGNLSTLSQTIERKAQGNPESFHDIFARVRNTDGRTESSTQAA